MGVDLLSTKSVSRLQALFQSIDSDNSGRISVAELERACSKLSLAVTKEDIDAFLGSDTNNDQELDFTEFQHFYVHQLKRVFNELDKDHSGGIDGLELRTAFEKLGFKATVQEVKALLAQVDKDQDQVVDFREFCNFFCSLPSPDLRLIVQQWATGLAIDTGADIAPPPLPPSSLVLWKAILAGGVAGIVSRSATAPLERIKILAQTGSTSPLWSTLRSTWRQSRWHGLFAGNAANCLRVFPFAGLVCLTYANIAHLFPLDSGTLSLGVAGRMGVGAVAGLVATLVTHPLDMVRARLTVQDHTHRAYRGITHALMEVGSKEGLTGLYKGVGPTLLAMVPFIAVQQSTYDVIKQQAMNLSLQPSVPLFLLCGSAAGLIAQTSVYPLEVVRRRMQVSQSTSTPSSALSMLRSLTVKQLFSGLSATYAKVIPSAAISVLVRDAILGRLKKN